MAPCSNPIGIIVTPEQCRKAVEDYVASHKAELDPVEGWPKLGSILAGVKATPEMRWASTVDVKSSVDAVLLATYGPKRPHHQRRRRSLLLPLPMPRRMQRPTQGPSTPMPCSRKASLPTSTSQERTLRSSQSSGSSISPLLRVGHDSFPTRTQWIPPHRTQ